MAFTIPGLSKAFLHAVAFLGEFRIAAGRRADTRTALAKPHH